MRRAVKPLSRAAVREANDRLARAHPELMQSGKLRQLNPNNPADAALRKEWIDHYATAGGSVEGGAPAQGAPKTKATAAPAKAASAAPKVAPGGSASCSAARQPTPASQSLPPKKPKDTVCRLTRFEVQRTGEAQFTINALNPRAARELQLVGEVEGGLLKGDSSGASLGGFSLETPAFPQFAKPKVTLAGAGMCGPDHVHAGLPTKTGSISQGVGGGHAGEVTVAVRDPDIRTFGEMFRLWRNPAYQGHVATVSGSACDQSASVAVEAFPSGEFKGSVDPKKLWEFITFDGNIVGRVVGELLEEDLEEQKSWRESFAEKLVPKFEIKGEIGVEWRNRPGTPDVEVETSSSLEISLGWEFDLDFKSPYIWWPCPHRYSIGLGLEFELAGSGGQKSVAAANRPDRLKKSFEWDASGELKLAVAGGVGVIHEVVLHGEAEVSGNFPIKLKPSLSEAPAAQSRDVTIKFEKLALALKVEALDGLVSKERSYILFENEGEPTTMFTVPDVLEDLADRLGGG